MMQFRIAIILLMGWCVTSCDALSSDTGQVEDDVTTDDDNKDDKKSEDNCEDDEQCCVGNVLSICRDGDWEEWDDCASYDQICTVRKGKYLCADKSEEGSDSSDTDLGDDSESTDDTDDSNNGDTDSEDADSATTVDTGEETDEEPVPEVEGKYADVCATYCLNLSHCGLEAPNGDPYRDSLTWFTDQRHCAADCTTETNAKLELVMISCEQAEFDLFICEMGTKSCDDLQLLINAMGETSELPCGDEIDDVLDACY